MSDRAICWGLRALAGVTVVLLSVSGEDLTDGQTVAGFVISAWAIVVSDNFARPARGGPSGGRGGTNAAGGDSEPSGEGEGR